MNMCVCNACAEPEHGPGTGVVGAQSPSVPSVKASVVGQVLTACPPFPPVDSEARGRDRARGLPPPEAGRPARAATSRALPTCANVPTLSGFLRVAKTAEKVKHAVRELGYICEF